MTNTELKNKIADSVNSEWYWHVNEIFNFTHIDSVLPFQGVSTIYEYVNQQINGWSQFEDLPNELMNSKKYFENIKQQIIHFFNNYYNQQENNLNAYWNNVKKHIANTQNYPFPYDSPYVEFLVRIHKENPKYFLGAFNYITGNNFNINNKQNFFGALLVYEYLFKE